MKEIKNSIKISKRYIFNVDVKTIVILIAFLMSGCINAQESSNESRIPPPPCYANGNTGFSGAIGEGHFLSSDSNSIVQFNMSTSGNDMNDILVLYIDTGATGRNTIDTNIDDSVDIHRVAISNSDAFGFGSIIQFPSGFEASYAVAVNTDFAGLWSIPTAGAVGDNGLNFITAVNSTLTSSTQGFYEFNFDWADIGLTETDSFNFVGVYVSGTGYSSDEGYGSGIVSGTQGADDITFNGYLSFPECNVTLSDTDTELDEIKAAYVDGYLHLDGINEVTEIRVYDILGREVYNATHNIQASKSIPIELRNNELQFIVIEASNKKKVLKVIPN